MEIFGHEYGLLYSVGAMEELREHCPDHDLNKLGRLLDDAQGGKEMLCIMSRWHEKAEAMKAKIATIRCTGYAGGNMVEAVANGNMEIESIKIDPEFAKQENAQLLEVMITSAVNTAIKNGWGEFKTTVTERGATVEKPPKVGKSTMTKEQIDAIQDTAERQKAIAENHELYGF